MESGNKKPFSMQDRCGHGKKWGQCCPLCDAVWFSNVTIPALRDECRVALKFLRDNPNTMAEAAESSGLPSKIEWLLAAIEQDFPEKK
jgi:hypothetical protein